MIDNRAYGITGDIIWRYIKIDRQHEARIVEAEAQHIETKLGGERLVIPREITESHNAAIEELTCGDWADGSAQMISRMFTRWLQCPVQSSQNPVKAMNAPIPI